MVEVFHNANEALRCHFL